MKIARCSKNSPTGDPTDMTIGAGATLSSNGMMTDGTYLYVQTSNNGA